MMRICGGLKGPNEQPHLFKVLILHMSWARIRFGGAAFGASGPIVVGPTLCADHFGATLG